MTKYETLLNNVTANILPEVSSGFKHGRATAKIFFSVRQLHEKCPEQNMNHIDLTKAFDTMNRYFSWKILKLTCSDKFVFVLRDFHEGMKVPVYRGGKTSDTILG